MSRALIVGAVLSAGLVSGGLLIQSGAWSEAGATTASSRLLEQVMVRVARNYIDTLTVEEMQRRAAFGLVKEIDDPYSVLLTPERLRRVREATTGRYAGIGIEIDLRDGFVTVVAPIAGTPADSAGIKPGDRVMTIDDKSTHGLTMEEVQQLLRGASGTRVKLGIDREGGDEHPTVTLTRREITFHPVQRTELVTPAVGYVALATFSERAAREVLRAVDTLRGKGAKALILDVRENPGGLLEEGVGVAELFLDPRQTIASTRGRTPDANQEFEDQSPQRWPGLPIVVLVDSGTASAAEIVAGALQDNKRAVLVGTDTYGKGSAQSLFPVAGGAALKLTTARWFTPEGRSIERDSTKGGISPDVIVPVNAGRSAAGARLPLAADPMVARALQLLQGVTTPAQLRGRVPAAKRS